MAHFQISMAGAGRIPLAGVALIAAVGPRGRLGPPPWSPPSGRGAGSDRHHDRHRRPRVDLRPRRRTEPIADLRIALGKLNTDRYEL